MAGIPGEEATVKHWRSEGDTVVLVSSNPDFEELRFPVTDVAVIGRVVTVLRRL